MYDNANLLDSLTRSTLKVLDEVEASTARDARQRLRLQHGSASRLRQSSERRRRRRSTRELSSPARNVALALEASLASVLRCDPEPRDALRALPFRAAFEVCRRMGAWDYVESPEFLSAISAAAACSTVHELYGALRFAAPPPGLPDCALGCEGASSPLKFSGSLCFDRAGALQLRLVAPRAVSPSPRAHREFGAHRFLAIALPRMRCVPPASALFKPPS